MQNELRTHLIRPRRAGVRCCRARWLRPALALAVALAAACEASSVGADNDQYKPDAGPLGDTWNANPSRSPTGTTLTPTAPVVSAPPGVTPGPVGYAVIDEMCGGFALPGPLADRAKVFKTPLFRSLVVEGTRSYVVDGTNLWTFDLSAPAAPDFVAVQPVPGAPVALATSGGALYAATVEGLRRFELAGNTLPDAGVALPLQTADPVLDVAAVTLAGGADALLLARGTGGVTLLTLDASGQPSNEETLHTLGLANAVAVQGTRVAVAACMEVRLYELGDDLTELQALPMPYGAAKSVALDGERVYVGAGLAMLAIRTGDQPSLLGHYADPVAGFYVNDVVAKDGVVYVAAGDQSVRAVRIDSGALSQGVPFTWLTPDLTVDSPVALPTPTLATHDFIIPRDPLALTLSGDLLYALGNFRYRGQRTIEVFNVAQPGYLQAVGGWAQPDALASAGLTTAATVLSGPEGAWVVPDDAQQPITRAADVAISASASWATRGYLAAREGGLFTVDAAVSPEQLEALGPSDTQATALSTDEQHIYVSSPEYNGVLVVNREPVGLEGVLSLDNGFLGEAALAVVGARLLAYDRVTGLLATFAAQGPGLPRQEGLLWVGVCEAYDFSSTFDGTRQAEARFAVSGDRVVLLCPAPQDGSGPALLEIEPSAPELVGRVALPAGIATHVALSESQTPAESRALAVMWDPARLETTLAVVAMDGESDVNPEGEGAPPLAVTTFLGHGAGVVPRQGGWLVGDAFWRKVWRFDANLALLGTRELPL